MFFVGEFLCTLGKREVGGGGGGEMGLIVEFMTQGEKSGVGVCVGGGGGGERGFIVEFMT